MKRKLYLPLLAVLFSVSSITASASSGNEKFKEAAAAMSQDQKESRIAEIEKRAQEIKEMDKSQLSTEERKSVRAELKSMNKESKAIGHGGIYISVAGIIIIILILILIL